MFSGQGSHYYQMGREQFNNNSIFRQCMEESDKIFNDLTGLSLIKEIYQKTPGESDIFTRTLFTHPAIFSVQYALGQILISQGIKPDYVLGTSLGEFTAAVFANIVTFENALKLVIKQAQLFEAHCQPGNMIAILHAEHFYQTDHFLKENSELAASNFDSHFVIACKNTNLVRIENYLKEKNIIFQKLAVSHGFHSSGINEAQDHFLKLLKFYPTQDPTIPFISCTCVNHVNRFSSKHFWEVARLPIQFQRTIQYLENKSDYLYLDIGPSSTLATFMKYILGETSGSKTLALLSPLSDFSKNLTKIYDYI